MELTRAVEILAAFAEGLPHQPEDPDIQTFAERLEVAYLPDGGVAAVIDLKKATVVAAGALKSIVDQFGMPGDQVMFSIKQAVEGIGQMVEQPGVFDVLTAEERYPQGIVDSSVEDDPTNVLGAGDSNGSPLGGS